LMAAQTGLLPTQPITAQINLGLSLWLDEKRGSRHSRRRDPQSNTVCVSNRLSFQEETAMRVAA